VQNRSKVGERCREKELRLMEPQEKFIGLKQNQLNIRKICRTMRRSGTLCNRQNLHRTLWQKEGFRVLEQLQAELVEQSETNIHHSQTHVEHETSQPQRETMHAATWTAKGSEHRVSPFLFCSSSISCSRTLITSSVKDYKKTVDMNPMQTNNNAFWSLKKQQLNIWS